MQYLTCIRQYLVRDAIFSFDLNIARSNLREPLAASANSGCLFETDNSQQHFFSFSINHGTQHTFCGTTFPCTACFIFIIFPSSCKSVRFKLCYSHLWRYQQTPEYLRDQSGHCDFWEGNQCLKLHLEKALFAKQQFPTSVAIRSWEDLQLCHNSWTWAFCELLPSVHKDTLSKWMRNATLVRCVFLLSFSRALGCCGDRTPVQRPLSILL